MILGAVISPVADEAVMRRVVFAVLAVIEFGVAGAIISLAWQLPSSESIQQGFQRAEGISGRAGTQVRLFRNQVRELRRPELNDLSRRLQREARTLTKQINSQQVDYKSVKAMRDALGDLAEGMHTLSTSVDEEQLAQVGKGLGDTARFLDDRVVPAAEQASRQLDGLSRALKGDADRLAKLVRESPADLKTARELHKALGNLSEGIGEMEVALSVERIGVMREGFGSLAEALASGAEEAETRHGLVGPEGLTFEALARSLERPGSEDADMAPRMRRAAEAARAARRELGRMADDLPRLRAALGDSRRVIERTRDVLGNALNEDGNNAPLLKELPSHLSGLAEELPRLSANLSRVLSDTRSLRELASALRRAEKGVDVAIARWPDLKRLLGRTADLLRSARRQLDFTLRHRHEYEAALQQTVSLADAFASMLPLMTEHLEQQLSEQELALDELGQSIDDFNNVLPETGQQTVRMLETLRLLLFLVSAGVSLHGVYLILGIVVRRPVAV
jgi:DNA repair exonuclease SbcCD ATPase subunit